MMTNSESSIYYRMTLVTHEGERCSSHDATASSLTGSTNEVWLLGMFDRE